MSITLVSKMKITQKTSPSYNQDQLKAICDKLCDNIVSLFDILELPDIVHNGKMYVGPCPIHNGDNKTAFNLYPDGDTYRGNWKCRTHGCERLFKGSVIGFVRGVLSNKKYNWSNINDRTISFQETIEFIQNFLGHNLSSIKISKTEIEKNKFISAINSILVKEDNKINKVSRSSIRNSLLIPSEYFIKRGFDTNILDKYDVGLCDKTDKEMYQRAVAPIYDLEHKYMVGCTGRSIFDKCKSCSCYHDPHLQCPEEADRWKFSKWKHNYQFKSQNHLYNLWFAKDFILSSGSAILVESPGNVWKLEQNGIHNSVALFGSNLSDKQKILLDGSGAMTIITIMDNDDAGKKAAEAILSKCKNTYKIININITKSDVAEMTDTEINSQIKKYL